jgi:flagellar hook-associated protein 1 FlgK
LTVSTPLNSILSIARGSLLAQQLALGVTSHNLANVTTEGFSRQRAELEPGVPVRVPQGLLGTGVRVADITRARDALLDGIYRREHSLHQGFLARYDALGRIEGALAEPSELSLGAALSAFWNSWSDLASDPVSSSARVAVVAAGQRVVDRFHRLASDLASVRDESVGRLEEGLRQVSALAAQIASLNEQIVSVRAGGRSAPDLEDRRDALLDELARYVPVTVTAKNDGSVGVVIDGIAVVEGTVHRTLVGGFGGGGWQIGTSAGSRIDAVSGLLGGLLSILNDELPRLRDHLDVLARALVERVNAIHSTGTNPLGTTGVRFFDDQGSLNAVSADTLALDIGVSTDARFVSAGTPDGTGSYRAGANDVALAIAALRTDTSGGLLSGIGLDAAYRDLASDVAFRASSAREATDAHAALASAARERRESVSGVATDEELVRVIQIQAAYGATARLLKVVDEMYQSLLAI